MKQPERDLALLGYWQEKRQDAIKALETAERQIAYLGQLIAQYELEIASEDWVRQRDGTE